jgi:hypothetical protein
MKHLKILFDMTDRISAESINENIIFYSSLLLMIKALRQLIANQYFRERNLLLVFYTKYEINDEDVKEFRYRHNLNHKYDWIWHQ